MQFKDVIVPQETKDLLIKQIRNHRISHAQLFLAQPGNHAFALALAMGQYLCCDNPSDTDSCGQCPSCQQYAKLTHPDLHIYFPNCTTKGAEKSTIIEQGAEKGVDKDPDSIKLAPMFRNYVFKHHYHIDMSSWVAELNGDNKQPAINIRDCSNILTQNNIRSYMGGYKIYILWNVDRLRNDAANKILKTLEEPADQSLFILITEHQEQIISTILSRTQLVKIPRLTDHELAQGLQREIPELTTEQAAQLAYLAEGNIHKALQIHKNGSDKLQQLQIATKYLKSAIDFAQNQPLDIVNHESVLEDIAELIKQGREQQKSFLTILSQLIRNILIFNNEQHQLLKLTPAELSLISEYKNRLNLKHISLITEECNKAQYHISRNCNTSLVLEDLYFKISNIIRK